MTQRDGHRSPGRRTFIKIGGAAGVTALAGCTGGDGGGETDSGATTGETDSAPETIVIGSNHPLTGGLSYTGGRMDQAVQLAAMLTNEAGGISSLGGAELEVISGDNEGAQELGAEVAQQLIDDGAHVLTGCYSSPVSTAAARVAERAQVPFVISVSVANSILQETQLNYVYRPQPSAAQMGIDHARLMPQIAADGGIDVTTAGLYYIDISFGQSIRDTLREELPKNGVEVVAETPINFGETADTQVTQLRDADPDVVISTTYNAETVELVRAMDAQNYTPPLLAGCSSAAFNDVGSIEQMGATADGSLATNFALDPTDARAAEVQSRFESEFGEAFDANVAMTFASVQAIIAGIEAAGSADTDAINDALGSITVEDHIAAMPPMSFDDRGENANALAPLFQVQGDNSYVVAPEDYAARSPTF